MEEICRVEESVVINFSQMKLNNKPLREFGELPEDCFEAIWDLGCQKWNISYSKADEYFEGDTLTEVVQELVDFLKSDEVIENVGPATVCFAN